ncbi:hypothetical protein TI03_04665, partial [Achromatium sp. WMS1]
MYLMVLFCDIFYKIHTGASNMRNFLCQSGSNESGKSSIGEAICFALFGRTFAIKQNEIRKLIRWGESSCSVILGFSLKDGICYRLSRSLDRENNHSARLYRTIDPDHPIARGVTPVAAALEGILGYDFGAFIDSFYLAQREITTPHPYGHAIHIMAGIAPLMTCRTELQEELERKKNTQSELTNRIADTKIQIDDLAFNPQHTHILTTDKVDLANREKQLRQHKQTLDQVTIDYKQRMLRQKQDANNQFWFKRLGLLSMLLAILGFSTLTSLTLSVDHPLIASISSFIKTIIPSSQWILYGSSTFTAITILSWMRVFTLNKRRRALQTAGMVLADALSALDNLEISLPKTLQVTTERTKLYKKKPDHNSKNLQQKLTKLQMSLHEIEDITATRETWLDQVLMQLSRQQTEIYQKLLHESEQEQIYDRLTSLNVALQKEHTELQEHIKILIQAEELLQGAMRHLSHRFNHHLRGLAGKTLPMFTENRYQHLQIDEDLTVRAFSNAKRDFMELDEISSGTQRQVMLALRLSLSQQLIGRVVQ